jgi:hypothetical protein
VLRVWQVPDGVLTQLLTGLADDTAHHMLRTQDPAGRVLQPGDAYGLVLSWLWRDDPDRAMVFIAILFSQLRKWDERSSEAVTLDALLAGIRFSLQGLTEEEEAMLIDKAGRDVPELL